MNIHKCFERLHLYRSSICPNGNGLFPTLFLQIIWGNIAKFANQVNRVKLMANYQNTNDKG